jgi:hypothetical protein
LPIGSAKKGEEALIAAVALVSVVPALKDSAQIFGLGQLLPRKANLPWAVFRASFPAGRRERFSMIAMAMKKSSWAIPTAMAMMPVTGKLGMRVKAGSLPWTQNLCAGPIASITGSRG